MLGDARLTDNQRADVNQLFCFSASTGVAVFGAAFVTLDQNFLRKGPEVKSAYGLAIATPTDAWNSVRDSYHMPQPSSAEIDALWRQQGSVLARLRSGPK